MSESEKKDKKKRKKTDEIVNHLHVDYRYCNVLHSITQINML